MSNNQACCAHLRVTYEPIDNGDGTCSTRWTCDSCGHDFAPLEWEAIPDRYPIGDVVVLASDVERRWPMTVTRHETSEHCEVLWLDGDGEPQSRYVNDAALRPYEIVTMGYEAKKEPKQ